MSPTVSVAGRRDPRSGVRPIAAALLMSSVLLLMFGAPALDALRRVESRWTGEPADVCAFKLRYGVPCLGCGGTHAFSYAARGEIARAFRANLLGASIAVVAWLVALT